MSEPHHMAHHHHHHHGMQHRFEGAEHWASVFDDPERDAWQRPDLIISALDLAPSMTVADVGAGTGYFSVRLSQALPAGQVFATDIEPDMVGYITQRAEREGRTNIRAMLATQSTSGLTPSSVDRILIVDVWHHLGDRALYARDIASALRPGGKILVVDFRRDAERGPPPAYRLAPETIASDLAAAGLTARILPDVLPDQYMVVAER